MKLVKNIFKLLFITYISIHSFQANGQQLATMNGQKNALNNSMVQEISKFIDKWVMEKKWAWDGLKQPSVIIKGHIIDEYETNIIALFSVADGGSNTSQYIYIFYENEQNLMPLNVFKIGQRGSALISKIKINDTRLIISGTSYRDDNKNDYFAIPVSIKSRWICRISKTRIEYLDGPKLPWIDPKDQHAVIQVEARAAQPKGSRPPVLSPEERRQAELPFGEKIAWAVKGYPEGLPGIKAEAYADFISKRALKKIGFTPGGVDYFYQIFIQEMNRHGGIAFAYDAAFRVAKESVWSKRGWNEAEARAKVKILNQAMEDVHRVLIGE
jgi:hypothetical protein